MNDDELEHRLRADLGREAAASVPPPIDVGAVRARADAGRRSRRAAYGGAALAVVIVAAGLGTWLGGPTGMFTASTGASDSADAPVSESAGAADESEGGGIRLAPPEKVNGCEGPVADATGAEMQLVVAAVFPAEAPIGTEPIVGEAVVTNVSDMRVTGTTSTAAVATLAENGLTVWHTNGPSDDVGLVIDLEPGASMRLPAQVVPVRCTAADEEREAFPADLPALAAGGYSVSVLVPFFATSSDAPAQYLISEGVPLTLSASVR